MSLLFREPGLLAFFTPQHRPCGQKKKRLKLRPRNRLKPKRSLRPLKRPRRLRRGPCGREEEGDTAAAEGDALATAEGDAAAAEGDAAAAEGDAAAAEGDAAAAEGDAAAAEGDAAAAEGDAAAAGRRRCCRRRCRTTADCKKVADACNSAAQMTELKHNVPPLRRACLVSRCSHG